MFKKIILDANIRLEICRRLVLLDVSHSTIAKTFGVSREYIRHICGNNKKISNQKYPLTQEIKKDILTKKFLQRELCVKYKIPYNTMHAMYAKMGVDSRSVREKRILYKKKSIHAFVKNFIDINGRKPRVREFLSASQYNYAVLFKII